MISLAKLINNDITGMSIIEVTSMPHLSILSDGQLSNQEQLTENYNNAINILTEVYQKYKHLNILDQSDHDLALELLWLTQAVNAQTYSASIRLFITIRFISNDEELIRQHVQALTEIFELSLKQHRYEYSLVDVDDFSQIISPISTKPVTALVKEEKVENLQNLMMPYCFSFDRMEQSNQDLGRIINTLINYPNCALAFQLIPTFYTHEEISQLDEYTQQLDMLSKGVADASIGNVSFSLASKQAEVYGYYNTNKHKALFKYNILIFADSIASSNLPTIVFGQLNYSSTAVCNLKYIALSAQDVNLSNNLYPLPWAVNEILLNHSRSNLIWQRDGISPNLYRLPYIITAYEASELFRLPYGNDRIEAGLSINRASKNQRSYTDNIINNGDLEIGRLKASALLDSIGISKKDLTKHMLIVGTPGSGKTTFSIALLDKLWKEHRIPFLVIEPAKNEYRALVESIPDLQVFTPGKNFISPFIFNPFIPPTNVKLESYKTTLKTAFAAGVSMSSPLDKIFEEAINNCYSDFMWLDSYTSQDKGKVFNIMDFIKCFKETFDEIGYTGDARNIGRAGVVRLQSLVNLFDNYHSIPVEEILSQPTIIELAAIENSDQKALLISLILLSISSYVNANYLGEGELKNFILLEEAHVLLDGTDNTNKGEADPSAIAQALLKRMLAEMRSYGVGIAIADQSPRKIGLDIVALTDIKVAFRLVEAQDKMLISSSTNMSEALEGRLSRLRPGEAVFFFNKLNEPEEIVTEDYRLNNQISITLSDEGIKSLSTYWSSRQGLLRPYPECALVPYCNQVCNYCRRILAREIARRIFRGHFKVEQTEKATISTVFSNISYLIKQQLNDEPFDRELLSCVKVHLWRKIRYNTKINIASSIIFNSLIKK